MEHPTSLGQFRQAVEIYLEIAYQGQPLPEVVRQRLHFPEADSLEQLLTQCSSFEASKKGTPVGANGRYRLRLGNLRYQHMKMAIQWLRNEQAAIFAVDTHDQHIAPDPGSEELQGFKALQDYNARLKESIHAAWQDAGLPTFCEYVAAPSIPPPGGQPSSLVLVVEDEVDILEHERWILESGGCCVQACSRGSQALELVDQGARPDVCVLDIMMPEMDGFRLCENLRSRLGPDLPVVFVSSFPAEAVGHRVQNYLEKPFSPEELIQKVRAVLPAPRSADGRKP